MSVSSNQYSFLNSKDDNSSSNISRADLNSDVIMPMNKISIQIQRMRSISSTPTNEHAEKTVNLCISVIKGIANQSTQVSDLENSSNKNQDNDNNSHPIGLRS